jgi:DNA mismatch repair protein MutL
VVGQIGGLYVLLETEDGYVIMDPHAAHERVMFEKFMRHYTRGQIPTQGLLVPETVELLPRDALHVRRNLELLRKMGFGVAEFGGDTFVVDALPAFFAGAAARALLAEVAQELEEAGSRGGAREKAREEAVAQAACKAAVKAHDRLSLEAIEQLVVDLASAEMPYTCPHGRPTLVYTSFQELNRKFGRE